MSGSINGSRLPWNFKVDLRVWKKFRLNFKKDESAKSRRPVYLNIYLQVQNLLNTKNIIGVHAFTGAADDDGYLNSTAGIDAIERAEVEQSFVDLYSAYISSGFNPKVFRNGRCRKHKFTHILL